jgi:UDP-glucose 4-epimerase
LVTGAASLVGIPLVRALRRCGKQVVAVDDGSAGTFDRLREFDTDDWVYAVTADVRDSATLAELVRQTRPEQVVHLAARHPDPDGEPDSGAITDDNVLGTQNLIDACAAYPPRCLVLASTSEVYAPSDRPCTESSPIAPQGPTGFSKHLEEQRVLEQADRLGRCCRVVIARLFDVYGPGDPHRHLIPHTIRQVAQGATAVRATGLADTRDYLYAGDAAQALSRLLDTDTAAGIYNVGTGLRTSGHEVVALIGQTLGTQVGTLTSPGRSARRGPRTCVANPTKLAQVLSWCPTTSLEVGLALTVSAHTYPTAVTR